MQNSAGAAEPPGGRTRFDPSWKRSTMLDRPEFPPFEAQGSGTSSPPAICAAPGTQSQATTGSLRALLAVNELKALVCSLAG